MRLYLKRFIWLTIGAFLCPFVVLNFVQLMYEQDLFDLGEKEEPWGVNFDIDHRHGRVIVKEQIHKNSHVIAMNGSNTTTVLPSSVNDLKKMWPSGSQEETTDRIVEQLYKFRSPVSGTKSIVIKGGRRLKAQERLISEMCPVNQCTFSHNMSQISTADAVLFFGSATGMGSVLRPPHQIWAMYQLESPHHSSSFSSVTHSSVNWTATYRRDSVLVTPYEKFVHFDNFTRLPEKPSRNYAEGKSKRVAWFASNCHAPNGRHHYVKELEKYIDVDIYGSCGSHQCPRADASHCFSLLNKEYKFYLAFENSNCKDYITEKLYWNALGNDIVPVVMGAHPDDYLAVAPPESYIHVDHFESPKDLARYLHKLDQNPDLYNSYFRWKGTGQFINTKFWCRFCNMVHAADYVPRMSYVDLKKWWHGDDICVLPTKKLYASWRYKKRGESFWKNNTRWYRN